MKYVITIIFCLFALLFSNANEQYQVKRYQVKSGIMEYETTISRYVMDSTTSGNGIKKLYSKDWGAVELKEIEAIQTTTVKFFGKKSTDTKNTHSILKLDNGLTYHCGVWELTGGKQWLFKGAMLKLRSNN